MQQHIIIKCRHISGEVLVHQGKEARHTQGDCKVLRVLKGQAVGLAKEEMVKVKPPRMIVSTKKGEIKARIKIN